MKKRYSCIVCSTEFFSKNVTPKFCSRKCKHSLGHNEETKAKIRAKRALQIIKTSPIMRSGYVYIKTWGHPFCGKQGYVAEHRLVMEKHIGRFLNPEETVHHVDGDKTNNSIENLELFATRGEHTKHAHPEVRVKSSISHKGKRVSMRTEFKKGQNPWNKKVS